MKRAGALLVLAAGALLAATAYGEAPKKAATAPGAAPKKPAGGTVARAGKPQAPSKYASYVRSWHTPAPGKTAPTDANGRAMLVLYALNTNDRVELPASSEHGGFSASDLDRVAWVMREPHSGNEHPIEPRLVDVVYRIQTHFAAHEIRIVSGYRTPHGGGSNHGRGRAMDLVVPGASDQDVARFAREIGFVGVGVYPVSGFVHVDVRDRSYFWIDGSGPGRRNRERGILGDLAKRSDAAASQRGERPVPPLFIATDVDLAMGAVDRAGRRPDASDPHAGSSADEDDDDVDGT